MLEETIRIIAHFSLGKNISEKKVKQNSKYGKKQSCQPGILYKVKYASLKNANKIKSFQTY